MNWTHDLQAQADAECEKQLAGLDLSRRPHGKELIECYRIAFDTGFKITLQILAAMPSVSASQDDETKQENDHVR